jgi:hypothetical protein
LKDDDDGLFTRLLFKLLLPINGRELAFFVEKGEAYDHEYFPSAYTREGTVDVLKKILRTVATIEGTARISIQYEGKTLIKHSHAHTHTLTHTHTHHTHTHTHHTRVRALFLITNPTLTLGHAHVQISPGSSLRNTSSAATRTKTRAKPPRPIKRSRRQS